MALVKCKECDGQISSRAEICPHCGVPANGRGLKKPKRWHERTSVTLCIAAVLIVVGFGFIHVITGVVSPYNLPFDIVFKESFGYRETFVNAAKIQALPYDAAKIKYPLGCRALQRRGYIESGSMFEARMDRHLRENMQEWLEEFQGLLNKPEQRWQDQLRGQIQVSKMDPEDPNAYNSRGIISAKEGRYEEALAHFTRAFRRNPVFADAYFNRGLVDLAIGQLGQAVSDFTNAIQIKPELIEGYATRGAVYFAMNQYDEAISDFTKIIELAPASPEAYFKRSLACYANGQYDQAWHDVYKIQSFDLRLPSGFLALLNAASGKRK